MRNREQNPMRNAQVDVAVIGAGIFGLSAAWACHKRGMSVRVFEEETVGAGASGGLVGALAPHMPEKWNPKKAFQLKALLGAQAFWDEVAEASGMPSGYKRIGRALPLRSERLRNQAEVRAQEVPLLWQGQAEWHVVDEVQETAPASHGYVHETLSARLRPRAAVAALAKALSNSGVEIVEKTRVLAPDSLSATHVVIAAGYKSRELTGPMPERFWTGVKGQSAILDVVLPDTMPMVFENGAYVVPHGKRGVAVGSTVEEDWTDPDLVDHQLQEVIEKATTLVPALKGAQVKEAWAGIRPRVRLPDPALGKLPNGAWLLAGGFKIGLAIGPQMGETMAAVLDGEEPMMPPSFHLPFQLARCK